MDLLTHEQDFACFERRLSDYSIADLDQVEQHPRHCTEKRCTTVPAEARAAESTPRVHVLSVVVMQE